MRAWVAVMVAAIACGDGGPAPEEVVATSGSRLALSWYRFADGTEQPEPSLLYDRALHTACAPTPWIDGVVRCVPIAAAAEFVDAACSTRLGVVTADAEPTHFLAYERIDDEAQPRAVLVAGAEVTPPTTMFRRIDGACVGPLGVDRAARYYEVGAELAADALLPVREETRDGGRLALVEQVADDGLRAPIGLRDVALEVACEPTPGAEDRVVCAPVDAVTAAHSSDPTCASPAVVVDDEVVPRHARLVGADGCDEFFAVAAPLATPMYQRVGDACRAVALAPGARAFSVGAPIDLPTLTREVAAAPGRRLRPIVLGTDEHRLFDLRLHDSAIAGDCVRQAFADGVTRCIPADVAPMQWRFTATCVVAVAVAEVPARSCRRPAFAVGTTERGLEVRAIGDAVTEPLYRWVDDQCRADVATPGRVVHRLGPPIDPEAFSPAILYGAR